MKIKYIHYTKKNWYFMKVDFKEVFHIVDSKWKPKKRWEFGWMGDYNNYHIVVKKITKAEKIKEHEKYLKEIYFYLDMKGIPFVQTYRETKRKVLIGRFLGIEMWILK